MTGSPERRGTHRNILVLGIGNVLHGDDGIGPRCISELTERYSFSGNVRLCDGGTLGLRLLPYIEEAAYLIVIDALRNGGRPGEVYRMTPGPDRNNERIALSLHEPGLYELIGSAAAAGILPDGVVVGVEPGDLSAWHTELSPAVMENMERIIGLLLREIELAGGSYRIRCIAI